MSSTNTRDLTVPAAQMFKLSPSGSGSSIQMNNNKKKNDLHWFTYVTWFQGCIIFICSSMLGLRTDEEGPAQTWATALWVISATFPRGLHNTRTRSSHHTNIRWVKAVLTQPPLLFNQEVRLLRTNSPMQSTMVWTMAGWPWRTQSTAKAPATAYKDTTFPHVTPAKHTAVRINPQLFTPCKHNL